MPESSQQRGPVKRSITIAGHRTSLSMEAEFWQALQDIASAKGKSIAALIGEIDRTRQQTNLSSACRVYVLKHLQKR